MKGPQISAIHDNLRARDSCTLETLSKLLSNAFDVCVLIIIEKIHSSFMLPRFLFG